MASTQQLSFLNEEQTTSWNLVSGLAYKPEYISPSVESELISLIDKEPWLNDLKRRVQHYGYKYDYKARSVSTDSRIGELPDWLSKLSKELYERKIFPNLADQVIINEYQPGQGISPHIDCLPCFEGTIASLSLGSSCIMEFTNADTNTKIPLLLEPRSLLTLSGDARYKWQHSIPQRKSDKHNGMIITRSRRISLTFRKVIIRD